jgi:hypothetical protein
MFIMSPFGFLPLNLISLIGKDIMRFPMVEVWRCMIDFISSLEYFHSIQTKGGLGPVISQTYNQRYSSP